MTDARRSAVVAFALYVAIVAALAIGYLTQATAAGDGAPLMPVDDAYIHFQYARQAAAGQPFVYNPSDGPTSGATSLLYPFVLTAGYALGFTGLSLGYWAFILGAAALLASALTVRAMSRAAGLPEWLSVLMGAAVVSWGALVWHAFSGMETALVVACALLTFHTFERRRLAPFVAAASMLAVLRPEAGIMAAIAALLYGLRAVAPGGDSTSMADGSSTRRWKAPRPVQAFLLLPVAAASLQPLLNLALTGTANASGSQAKSLLSIVPFDVGYVAGRIAENLLRAWEGLLLGIDAADIWILPPLLGIVAIVGLARLARRRPFAALLAALWLVLIFGLIATLDTANWHFKRYHMPLLALAYPLVAHAAAGLASSPRIRAGLIGIVLVLSVSLNVFYLDAHRDNVESVAAQPLAMARWIAENTPPDALIAVHDVGLIRYLGGRETLDMVGLTTPGMADAWRSGPGAVGEALLSAPRRPDHIAAYTDARGLSYLAEGLYGELLESFAHEFDPHTNVALGGTFQGVFRPSWDGAAAAAEPRVGAVRSYLDGFALSDALNVGDLASERGHAYLWRNTTRFDGFATEMYLLDIPGCSADCRALDGGRRLNGFESFVLSAQPGLDHILVTRFHAPQGGGIRVVINDTDVIERTLPAIPGQFIEVPTLIPTDLVNSETLSIRIEPVTPGVLLFPYRHWLYAGRYPEAPPPDTSIVFQNGAFALDVDAIHGGDLLTVDLRWWTAGAAAGDDVAFVHLYDALDAPPLLQSDMRPGQGALPPGAWLPGTLNDQVMLDLSSLGPGRYTLAVGLYDPLTFERVDVRESGLYDVNENRVLIREVTIAAGE